MYSDKLAPETEPGLLHFSQRTVDARNFADASDLLIWRSDIFIFVLYSIWGWSVGGSVRVVREPGP